MWWFHSVCAHLYFYICEDVFPGEDQIKTFAAQMNLVSSSNVHLLFFLRESIPLTIIRILIMITVIPSVCELFVFPLIRSGARTSDSNTRESKSAFLLHSWAPRAAVGRMFSIWSPWSFYTYILSFIYSLTPLFIYFPAILTLVIHSVVYIHSIYKYIGKYIDTKIYIYIHTCVYFLYLSLCC